MFKHSLNCFLLIAFLVFFQQSSSFFKIKISQADGRTKYKKFFHFRIKHKRQIFIKFYSDEFLFSKNE